MEYKFLDQGLTLRSFDFLKNMYCETTLHKVCRFCIKPQKNPLEFSVKSSLKFLVKSV